MNTTEVLQICRMVKAACPSQQFDQYTPEMWALLLGDQSFEDARAAVIEIGRRPVDPGKSNYIEPGHIIGGIRRIRGIRTQSTPFPEPPAGLSMLEYCAWSAGVREAIANGTYQAEPRKAIDAATDAMPGRVAALIREAQADLPKSTIPKAAKPEQRAAINNEDAERERARQLAALEALTA